MFVDVPAGPVASAGPAAEGGSFRWRGWDFAGPGVATATLHGPTASLLPGGRGGGAGECAPGRAASLSRPVPSPAFGGLSRIHYPTGTLRLAADHVEIGDRLIGRALAKVLGIHRTDAQVRLDLPGGEWWVGRPSEVLDVERDR